MTALVKTFFDQDTSTFTHIVSDPDTQKAAVIDSVLNYDPASGRVTTQSADEVMTYLKDNELSLEWILETHIHADHLTAAGYIKRSMGGKIGIGSHIREVLEFWVPIFNTQNDTDVKASQFDVIFEDNQVFHLGNVEVRVLHTPGHTPACASYLIEDMIFVGDTLFMPDVGTARTDFPGGDAGVLYDSIQRILNFRPETKIYMCHDYPTGGREVSFLSTVSEERSQNILISMGISRESYVETRNKRDYQKPVPRLLLPSLQVNLRAGELGQKESNGIQYIKIPLNKI